MALCMRSRGSGLAPCFQRCPKARPHGLVLLHGDGADLPRYRWQMSIRQAMVGGMARVFAAVAALLLLVMPVLDSGAHAGQVGSTAAAASVFPKWLDVVDDASDHDQNELPCASGQVHIPLAVPTDHACGLFPAPGSRVSWTRADDERPVRGIFPPNERPPSV